MNDILEIIKKDKHTEEQLKFCLKYFPLEIIQDISESNNIFIENSIPYTLINKDQRVLQYILDSGKFYDINVYEFIRENSGNIENHLDDFEDNLKFIADKLNQDDLDNVLTELFYRDHVRYEKLCVTLINYGAKFNTYEKSSINFSIKHYPIEDIPKILFRYYDEIDRESVDCLYDRCSVFPLSLVKDFDWVLQKSRNAEIFLYMEELFENFHDFCLNNSWFFNKLALDTKYLHLTKYSNIEDLLFGLIESGRYDGYEIKNHKFTEEHIKEEYVRNFINETENVHEIFLLISLSCDVKYNCDRKNILGRLFHRGLDVTKISDITLNNIFEIFKPNIYYMREHEEFVKCYKESVTRGMNFHKEFGNHIFSKREHILELQGYIDEEMISKHIDEVMRYSYIDKYNYNYSPNGVCLATVINSIPNANILQFFIFHSYHSKQNVLQMLESNNSKFKLEKVKHLPLLFDKCGKLDYKYLSGFINRENFKEFYFINKDLFEKYYDEESNVKLTKMFKKDFLKIRKI